MTEADLSNILLPYDLYKKIYNIYLPQIKKYKPSTRMKPNPPKDKIKRKKDARKYGARPLDHFSSLWNMNVKGVRRII